MTQALTHYLQFKDLTADDYAYLFSRAAFIKHKFKTYDKHQPLIDRTLAMIFENDLPPRVHVHPARTVRRLHGRLCRPLVHLDEQVLRD